MLERLGVALGAILVVLSGVGVCYALVRWVVWAMQARTWGWVSALAAVCLLVGVCAAASWKD